MDYALLAAFIPTFFFVSITPGMCMTLALTLGMSIGYRKTLWMMIGELVGVGVVSVAAVLGIAAVMLKFPWLFEILKWVGGGYLFYIGIESFRSKGKLALDTSGNTQQNIEPIPLISQGFMTAVLNPKAYAFMISLLPPFINQSKDLAPQLIVLVSIILLFEFICMSIYATGGQSLKLLLKKSDNVKVMNRISGVLMMGVGVWLIMT
ncbi:LysE family translocator [Vibrio comitans]|uniref:Threonine transporter RhtB n=1 Tax=Vibrio comitans NBRC 102076 TaxID=1219078 RepID=A0A4Y3IIX4_9VIBR|nr:LysE family translocator [Vibrio comitans]GEA59307.1 threonine transporter RhtB [Vibrio comitans NBRC 102076]